MHRKCTLFCNLNLTEFQRTTENYSIVWEYTLIYGHLHSLCKAKPYAQKKKTHQDYTT